MYTFGIVDCLANGECGRGGEVEQKVGGVKEGKVEEKRESGRKDSWERAMKVSQVRANQNDIWTERKRETGN
jgi:hypothetical protein